LTYFWVNLTYLGRFNEDGIFNVEGGHYGLSFAAISEKNTEQFLRKLALCAK